MNMSDAVLERVVNLVSEGYDVRFTDFFSKDAIRICVRKNYRDAAQVVTIEEIKQSKFDAVLYAINRLVNLVDA